MSNLERLKQGYQLFAEGDIEGVLALFHKDIVWHQCKGLPYIEGDGIFNGHQEIVANIFQNIPDHFDDFHIEISDFVDGGNKIVMVGFYTGIWKPTGKRFKANVTHTWTYRDGKVAAFFQAVDTAEIIN